MNKVLFYREKLHLTQAELAEKSGVSIRTIQRIEVGSGLKGFTLKSLAKALNVEPKELIGECNQVNLQRVKLINLSALSFIGIPFGNIIIPALLTIKQNHETKSMAKKILTVQIIWTLMLSLSLLVLIPLQKAMGTKTPLFLYFLFFAMLLNSLIIVRNGWELNASGNLYIRLKNSIL